MTTTFKKRFLAYLIDIIIFSAILLIIGLFIKESANLTSLHLELNEINEKFLVNQLSLGKYFNQFSIIMYDISKEQIPMNIINAFLIVGYFVLLPYFFDGKTIGKKLMHIKIVRNDKECLMLNDLLLRNFIVNGLCYLLLSLMLTFIMKDIFYFLVVSILGFVQILLVIISAFMILYRKDKLALHDIISKTKVVDEVEQ